MLPKFKKKKKKKKPKTKTLSEIQKLIRVYSFRHLANKVLSHKKKVTMRLPRLRESEEGNLMHPYVVFIPGEARITKIVRKTIADITEEEAKQDGFESARLCRKLLMEMHKCDIFQPIDLTYFTPYWKQLQIVDLTKLKNAFDLTMFAIKQVGNAPNSETLVTLNTVQAVLKKMIHTEDPRVDVRGLDQHFETKEEK